MLEAKQEMRKCV